MFFASADAHVYSEKPDANYGASTSLRVDGEPLMRSYLRFEVAGLSDPIVDARVRVFTNTPSPDGWQLHTTGEGWMKGPSRLPTSQLSARRWAHPELMMPSRGRKLTRRRWYPVTESSCS